MNSYYEDHNCEKKNQVYYNVFNTTNFYNNDYRANLDQKQNSPPKKGSHIRKASVDCTLNTNKFINTENNNFNKTERSRRPYSSHRNQKRDTQPTIITTNQLSSHQNNTVIYTKQDDNLTSYKKSQDIQEKINMVMKQNREKKRSEKMNLNTKNNSRKEFNQLNIPIKDFDKTNAYYDKNTSLINNNGSFSTEVPRGNSISKGNIQINNVSLAIPEYFENRTDRIKVRTSQEKQLYVKKKDRNDFDTENPHLEKKDSKKGMIQQYVNALDMYYNSNAKNANKSLIATERNMSYNIKESHENPLNLSLNLSMSRKGKMKKNPDLNYRIFDKVEFKETLIGNITKNDNFDKKARINIESVKPVAYGLLDVREKMPFMTGSTFKKQRHYNK